MLKPALKWLRKIKNRVIGSIAFLPGVIALLFLGLSILMIKFDFSQAGKSLKSNLNWLSLKDASTARSICSSIAGGIISLAVFSFSMVMILLSQAAAQMSNRILGKLIRNRFQQLVLGFYIGTIVYALFLLSTIRDINTGIYVPAISTYLLIILTIVDIFLFIYFLHYITESVKFETIIHRIYDDTKNALKKSCTAKEVAAGLPAISDGHEMNAPETGLFQGFEKDSLINFCSKHDLVLRFHFPVGTYVMKGAPMLVAGSKKRLPEDFEEQLWLLINIGRAQDIGTHYYFGFRQLTEIAVKALSPGINDPGTANLSLQAIGDLMAHRIHHFPVSYYSDKNDIVRVIAAEKTFEDIFNECILPIWDYGHKDRLIQNEMLHILTLLDRIGKNPATSLLIQEVREAASREASS